jgi:flavin-dependent dehydrogenase
MPKPTAQLDVLVLGQHPATYLAALLIAANSKLRVAHCLIPGEAASDRLVLINPAFFELHSSFAALRRKMEMTGLYGLQFLGDEPATRNEFRGKTVLSYVAAYKTIRAALVKLAEEASIELHNPKTLLIHRIEDNGVELTVGKETVRAKALVLGGELPLDQQKLLGLPDGWGPDVVYRYTFLKLATARAAEAAGRPMVQMSLNLKETMCWGWFFPGPRCAQLAVAQPIESVGKFPSAELLQQWILVLRGHGILNGKNDIPVAAAESLDIPLAGALAHEGVANRTLLIGPAGGFYSACAEDIYPNCWSALFAAEAVKRALREPHLQDALQPYRQKWRTTLGEYLRGPQQNLRFLLPLIYRNPKMTARMAESILLGKSVVR